MHVKPVKLMVSVNTKSYLLCIPQGPESPHPHASCLP